MTQPLDAPEEYRKERHEFILEYYQMAIQDLSRHLVVGWQSITVAVGTIATLGFAQQGYLPIPLAVAAAVAAAWWGLWNIIDADFWALRAIAFLANVEALYFHKGDRALFNKYAGQHPSFRMTGSLKAQFAALLVIIGIALAFFAWKIGELTQFDLDVAASKAAAAGRLELAIWSMPVWLGALLAYLLAAARRDRLRDYYEFVRDSPGPGMVTDRSKYRRTDLSGTAAAADVETGETIQRAVREEVERCVSRWTWRTEAIWVIMWIVIGAMILTLAVKGPLWG